ncbi:MAG: endopeptidase La, partial [Deltaproteobacteria bacterium]|nr:endopeptidase La [Deltaproteobacteria bacterium]
FVVQDTFDPGVLADVICGLLPLRPPEGLAVLEEVHPVKRLRLAASYLNAQVDVTVTRDRIASQAQNELGKLHHEEMLREQIRQMQAELGEETSHVDELQDLTSRLGKLKMPDYAKTEAEKQIRRLKQLHPDTSEAALARTYLDWIMDLPWSGRTKDSLNLKRARTILDADHFGLEKAKERILDFLGVSKLRKEVRGPILLFVGPPGVGKTSLGRSIARALGRKFVRVSVGGLRDEAELRGHRRTYVGAMPGRIIQGLKNAGTINPVFMIDEIDKIGSDFRGDPASVLLESLDPEQNREYDDHYLNIPFDLSEVMFIATANMTDTIPSALLDRMEIIEIPGYTTEEKLEISKRYLIPKEYEANGLSKLSCTFDEPALLSVIECYTRESGVRELGRTIGTIYRKIARLVAEGNKPPKRIDSKLVTDFLGPLKFVPDKLQLKDEIGIVTGLAWTPVGGEVLTIEASVTPGKGQLSLTGQMGEVMRESAMAALTYVQSNAERFGIQPNFLETSNVHVHVPHGAIPKDGPSAGLAIALALVSLLTNRPVSREVAMTGEITLRGNILPVGGLREKSLAALRLGARIVIIPKDCERELVEFPDYLREQITFVPVESVDEAIQTALLGAQPLRTEGSPVKLETPTKQVKRLKPGAEVGRTGSSS